MFENKNVKIIFIIVALFGIWSYFSGLSIDVTRDAGKYATVAKEIFQNKNYINITVHGDPYDQKPPMLFWMGAAGFTVGGISNFWFKLPLLLLVFLGLYWAFRLGQSLYNKRVGYLTATFLFFSFIYSLYSMDIHTDTPLQAFITLALWQLYEFIKTRKNKYWITGFTAIGLAMLCKGPIGAAIPAFAVIGHILLKKDFKFLFNYKWFLGILLAFIVVSPALIGLVNQFGWKGIQFFFWDNNVGRITGSYVKAINDPVFYVHNLLYQFLPWSLLFYIAAFFEFKHLIINRFKSTEYFTFTGIWIYFIILNSASSQLPNYIFPIIPLIAVLAAKWTDSAFQQKNNLQKIFTSTQMFVVAILWILISVLVIYIFPVENIFYKLLIGVAIITSTYIYVKIKDKLTKLLLPSIIAFTCLIFILNNKIYPYIFSYQAPPKAAKFYTKNAKPGEKLFNYKYGQYELFFYSEPQALQIHNKEEFNFEIGKKGNWFFTDAEGFAEISALNLKTDTIIQYKHLYLDRGGKFINPKTRDEVLHPMYLIKY